jgi:hypothetical protein
VENAERITDSRSAGVGGAGLIVSPVGQALRQSI